MRCLEIGPELKSVGGDSPPPRIGPLWELLDVVQRKGIDWIGEWGKLNSDDGRIVPLPIDDNTFDYVYASHVLEHVWWYLTVSALQDAKRILRPQGKLEIWVPDFMKIVDAYLDDKPADNWRRHNPHDDPMLWVNGRIFTYGPGTDNWHRAVFDIDSLKGCFTQAGFINVHQLEKPTGPNHHGWINLGVVGEKS